VQALRDINGMHYLGCGCFKTSAHDATLKPRQFNWLQDGKQLLKALSKKYFMDASME
jgi:hypothetical protein